MHTPFDRSYWVVPGQFLAGYYPGDRDPLILRRKLRDLLDSGIRCTINLMERDERDHDGLPFPDYEPLFKHLADGRGPIFCHRMPIRDLGTPSTKFMVQILDCIDASLEADRPVYVHCWGGRGRTGTVVGCWLVRHGMEKGDSALNRIAALRRNDPKADWPSPEMPHQVQRIRSWRRRR